MIYTVFPVSGDEMPQDFETRKAAQDWAAELKEQGIDSEIEAVEGDVE